MSYQDEVAKICRLANGWTVEVYEPPTAAEEKKEKSEAKDAPMCCESSGEWHTLAFSTLDEVLSFIKSKEPDLKPRDYDEEYASSFSATIKSMTKPEKKK